MNVHPNQTTVRAEVKQITPCAGGYGHDLDLEILGNDSPDPNADYLKPKAGDRVTVFAADLGGLKSGERIRATLALSGGPFNQRTVLRGAERVAVKP
jgi:hypothetical protein